ncbi:MAG: transporter [Ilumatobacteraceae bacterium]|nr:transporter [Ilumatobacteraceae bacterium]
MTTELSTSPRNADGPRQQARLRVEHLTVHYGEAVEAVHDVSFTVQPGEIVALLGANGAGKSSLLNAISGLTPITSGSISVGDVTLDGIRPQRRARHVAHVPEGRQLFALHTVDENLTLSAFSSNGAERQLRLASCQQVLPALKRLGDRQAGLLSGGEQQMVALGRGLMSEAPVLMIDELSLGLAPAITNDFAVTLLELRQQGYAILLVEQYLTLALRVADRALVLDRGRVVLEGRTADIRSQLDALEEAYLGGGARSSAADELLKSDAPDQPIDPATAAPTPKRNGGVAVGGAVVALIAMLLPWFRISAFNQPTNTLNAWDLPAGWPTLAVIAAIGVAALGVLRLRSKRVLPLAAAAAMVALAAVLVATVATRCWLLEDGLTAPPGATVERRWGLLVAIYASAVCLIGALAVLRDSRKTEPGRPQTP